MGSYTSTPAGHAVIVVFALAACSGEDPDVDWTGQPIADPGDFTLPSLTTAQRAVIVGKYAHLDPNQLVPRGLLEDAMIYFDFNHAAIPKHTYFIVVDFSRYSGKDRFWMVNTTTGAVEKHKVAHGDGSDPDNNGYATQFSNVSGSHMSSLGFYLTGEIYDGSHPHSMRLDGLSPDGSPNKMANTNVRDRLVVVHEASYVDDANTSQQGRSNGCLALDPDIEAGVVDRIHDGTLIYGATSPLNPPIGPGGSPPCGTIAPTGGVVDDGDPCFTAGGPTTGLHHEATGGMGNSLIWTRTTAVSYEQNYAEWTLNFAEAHRYRVEIYTSAAFAQSHQASYTVFAAGSAHKVTIDQTKIDGYQSLGEFNFAAGGNQSVHVGDNTFETTRPQLVFDAVRLTRVTGASGDGGPANAGDTADEEDPTDDGSGGSGGCSTSGHSTSALLGLALVSVCGRRRRR